MSKSVLVLTANSTFQQLEALKTNREKRNQQKKFLIEGVITINQAMAQNAKITDIIHQLDAKLSSWGKEIIAKTNPKQIYQLSPELMEQLSDKEETSEILALVELPRDDPTRIPLSSKSLIVVFDRPASPGNLGSSIRSCDAFGVDGVVITGHAADPYHPQSVRGSMGSIFAKPIVRLPSHKELMAWLNDAQTDFGQKPTIIGTSAKAEVDIRDCKIEGPTVMVMGNESHGLSAAYKSLCDIMVKIPMVGSASSLNISCALSIMAYEAMLQRGPQRQP